MVDKIGQVPFVIQVGRHHRRSATGRTNPAGHLLGLIPRLTTMNDDIRTTARQFLGNGPSNAAGRPRDDSVSSSQIGKTRRCQDATPFSFLGACDKSTRTLRTAIGSRVTAAPTIELPF